MKLNDRLSEMKEKRKNVKPYDERGGAKRLKNCET